MTQTVRIGTAGPDTEELRVVGPTPIVIALRRLTDALRASHQRPSMSELMLERLTAAVTAADREEGVLEAMLPPLDALTEAAAAQLQANAQARSDAMREFGAYTSAQLAELRHSRTTNPHTTTSRWLTDRRVFAVDTSVGRLFPAFQFDTEGEPRPVVRSALAAMGGQLRGWELLLWFTGSNGYLDGQRPVDALDRAPDDVVAAAAYQASLSED